MSTPTPTDQQGQLAMSLAHLRLCGKDLTAARVDVVAAAVGLSGARLARAVQLRELIGDSIAFCQRLAVVTEGDLRAEQTQQQ